MQHNITSRSVSSTETVVSTLTCRSLSSRESYGTLVFLHHQTNVSERWSGSLFGGSNEKILPFYRKVTICMSDNVIDTTNNYRPWRITNSVSTTLWYYMIQNQLSNSLWCTSCSVYKCLGCLRIWMALLVMHLMQYILDRPMQYDVITFSLACRNLQLLRTEDKTLSQTVWLVWYVSISGSSIKMTEDGRYGCGWYSNRLSLVCIYESRDVMLRCKYRR